MTTNSGAAMGTHNPFDDTILAAQIRSQKQYAWDLEKDLDWAKGIDLTKPMLPLDHDAIAFPGASREQKLVLSQLVGLVINSTICEMEAVISKLKDAAWRRSLKAYPVNPEMWELGELFFEEEEKHSAAFFRYNALFCKQMGIDQEVLGECLPKAWGSVFLKAIIRNAKEGGCAFWWVVATVEEVSLQIYRELHQWKDAVDPLYFTLHLRHLEEEARHRNYAFLMLEVAAQGRSSLAKKVRSRTDLLFAQFFSTTWMVSELHKALQVGKFSDQHEFFRIAASCVPLMNRVSLVDLAHRLFVSAPYLSVLLNTRNHPQTIEAAKRRGIFSFPFPIPDPSPTLVDDRESEDSAA